MRPQPDTKPPRATADRALELLRARLPYRIGQQLERDAKHRGLLIERLEAAVDVDGGWELRAAVDQLLARELESAAHPIAALAARAGKLGKPPKAPPAFQRRPRGDDAAIADDETARHWRAEIRAQLNGGHPPDSEHEQRELTA